MIVAARQGLGVSGGKTLPYKRIVDYIDTNGGGCTTDILIEADYNFRAKGRFAIVSTSGETFVGNLPASSYGDTNYFRLFFASFGHLLLDTARARIQSHGEIHLQGNVFYDFDIKSGTSRTDSYFKINGVDRIDSTPSMAYEARSYSPLAGVVSFCKHTNTSNIYGRAMISTLTFMSGDRTLADFVSVETIDGKAGLYDNVGGGIYTSTSGNQFALGS